MQNHHTLLLLAFAVISIVSCKKENNDGDWPPMKWEHSIPNFEKNKIKVDAKGGVFILKNTNYPAFYITGIYDCNSLVNNFHPSEINKSTYEYIGRWFSINKNNDILEIEIQPKNSDVNRTLTIEVEFMDTFDKLYFEQ